MTISDSSGIFRRRLRPVTIPSIVVLCVAVAHGAFAQADFSWDPETPEISQTVTFTIDDPTVIPLSWDFGGVDCEGTAPTIDCTWIPNFCRNIQWSYAESGEKNVTLVTDQGEVSHVLVVADEGTCCTMDGEPSAAFIMSPNPAFIGQTVVFTDLSSKSRGPSKDDEVTFAFEPENPAIGERVIFTISGGPALDSAEWNFGGDGCSGVDPEYTCTPVFTDCRTAAFTYAGAGEKTVRLTINGGLYETEQVLTVQNEGHCDDPGGECTYYVSPPSADFSFTGGSDTLSVSSGPTCDWSAVPNVPWITILSGETGTGNGSVTYSVAPNDGLARTGKIVVENRALLVHQDAFDDGDHGDTAPDFWEWTISLDGEIVAVSDQQNFSQAFTEPGLYTVQLEAGNCAGTDIETGFLVIEEPPTTADGWMVSSAVHAPGLNGTRWRTDVWIFNPGNDTLPLDVEFLPENTDNWLTEHQTLSLEIPPLGTAALDDVLQLIPGVIEGQQAVKGALLIPAPEEGFAAPFITSRTYNETPDGTYGQFVPSVPARADAPDRLFLTGLAHDSRSRTNIRLANLGTQSVDVTLYVLSGDGHFLGRPVPATVPALSTIQINAIAEVAWAGTDLDLFSVRIDTDAETVVAWASVVDNATGDPVLYDSFEVDWTSRAFLVPGVAHLAGANDSVWRSDITFFNPDVRPLDSSITYLPSEATEVGDPLIIENLQPANARFFGDVLGEIFLDEGQGSKGSLLVEGPGQGAPLPSAARSYNLAPSGGTFGQNLHVFDGTDLVTPGLRAFIPGVTLSDNPSTGFRTNIGLLSISTTEWAQVRLVLYDEDGLVAGEIAGIWLEPARLIQFNLSDRMHLGGSAVRGTVVVEHLSGASVVAYASIVDNRTQDPILIPASPEAP